MIIGTETKMKYYDFKKNWKRKIEPNLANKSLNKILVKDMNAYARLRNWNLELKEGMVPFDWECCDWWISKRGRRPKYWRYVKHAACHYLVRFNHRLAKLADPDRNWQIISSDLHSTVWDGEDTIFEFNFYAFGIPAQEAFRLAMFGSKAEDIAA